MQKKPLDRSNKKRALNSHRQRWRLATAKQNPTHQKCFGFRFGLMCSRGGIRMLAQGELLHEGVLVEGARVGAEKKPPNNLVLQEPEICSASVVYTDQLELE